MRDPTSGIAIPLEERWHFMSEVAFDRDMCHNGGMVAIPKPQPGSPREVRLGAQGRIVLPAEIRKALGLHQGQRLVAYMEDGRAVLETPENILTRIQAEFASARRKRKVSAVDELLAERRAEAAREAAEK